MLGSRVVFRLAILVVLSDVAAAAPVSPAARSVIPAAFEQIICMDYRNFKESQTTLTLKSQVLPDDLRTFEKALGYIGIAPEKDLDTLTFASFRNSKGALRFIGIGSGSFSSRAILTKSHMKTVTPVKYRDSELYPMFEEETPKPKRLWMTFLDDDTLVFGEDEALVAALSNRSGESPNMASTERYAKLIKVLQSASVWSVLDRRGSLEMVLSALEEGTLDKHPELSGNILNSYYRINFDGGLKFDLHVLTKETDSAQDLSDMLRFGTLVKDVAKNPGAKIAFSNMSVTSDRSALQIRFEIDQSEMQKLLQTKFFAAVSATARGRTDRDKHQ